MTKLISGRIAKVTSANVSADRYQFIGLAETEPDLGLPAVSGYVLSSDASGNRIWVDAASASGVPYFANTSGTANVALTANIANTVLTLSNFTTANLVEGINLYYTNARVLSALTNSTIQGNLNVIQNITAGANVTANTLVANNLVIRSIAVTNTVLAGNITGTSLLSNSIIAYDILTGNITANIWNNLYTANVKETSGNLYYTDARVYAAIQGNLALKANVSDLTTANVSELTNLYYTNARVVSAVLPYLTTSNVNEGSNLYYTNTRVNAFVQPYLTTANVSEVNNLYYTNARVRSTLSGGTGVLYDTANGIISIGQNVSTTANVQFSNVKVTNIISTSGDIFVGGNLIPSENAVFNFGSPTNVWKDFYLSATSLFVGNTKVSSNTSTGGLSVTTSTGQATDFTAANIFAGNATVSGLIYGNLIGTVSTLSNFTTANLAEGINLYYTNARVISAVTPYLTTANVLESNSNLYYTNARVVSAVLPYLTTSNVAEGSNLYYTNARVYSNVTSLLAGNIAIGNATIGNLLAPSGNILITGNIIPSLDSTFNFGSLDKQWKDFYLSAESLYVGGQKLSGNTETGLTLVNLTASNITTGNLVVTRSLIANVIGTVNSLSNFTTSNLAEGTNQYFTNARVISAFSSYLTTANVAESNSNLYYTNARVISAFSSYLTTANVSESNSNLYYTNARVTANLEQQSVNVFADVDITGIQTNGILTWNGTKFVAGTIDTGAQANTALFAYNANVANTVLSLSGLTTANLAESNVNLYFTNTRVVSALIAGENVKIEANGRISANVDTANVTFLLTNVADIALRVVNIENQTTSNLREGTNLYYTNTRVLSALLGNVTIGNLVTGTSVSNSYVTSGNVTAGNVIANGAFFVSGVGGSVTGANLISATNIQANSWLGLYTANVIESNSALYYTNARVLSIVTPLLTTSNVIEGSNLYYTNARVVSAVLPYLTTSNVAEGSNLYYTNTRVRSALSGGTGVSYDTTTGAISIGQNVASTANVTFYNVSITNNLTVYGGVTTYGANNISVSDNMIYLNSNSSVSNPDIGFAFNYNDGVYRHGGFFRDASDNGTFKVFENYSPEPDANIFIDTAHASFRLANLAATTFFGNVSGTAGTLSNFTTANLAEGTNQYFTNARVYSNVIALLPSLAGFGIQIQANGQINASAVASSGFASTSNVANTVLSLSNFTTANLSEGINLYYTNARVYSNVIALLPTLSGSGITIQANGQISANTQTVSLAGLSTTNLAEGSNLYYTNTRVRTAFTAGRGITISEGGIINNTGSSSQYNTGIDGTVGANVLATMSSVITFPTTAANDRFLLRSLHLVNTSGATALVSSNVLYATGNTAYMANIIPVAPGGVMEFIKTYQIFQPGDQINLQGYNTTGTATANLMSVMLTYETFYNDNSYMGTGQTIAASGTNTKIYNSANSFSIIESVKFINLQSSTVPITCYWGDANGVPRAHLAFGLQLPPNSSVELLQSTKRINQGDALYASYTGGSANGVSAFVSARYGSAYTIGTYTSAGLPGNTITASFGTSANEGTGLYYTIE